MKLKTYEEIAKAFQEAEITDETILSNELKKGDLIQEVGLGWFAEIVDNKKGNIRMANVHGFCTEMGSIYAWDIDRVCKDGKIYSLELTEKQVKDYKRIGTLLDF